MAEKQFDLLQALLDTEFKPEKDVPMRRFGAGAVFRVQALDGKDIQRVKAQATYPIKTGKTTVEKLDDEKFGALLLAKACVSPDWSDPKLLAGLGVPDATDAIQKRLLSGEIARLTQAILEVSGFHDDEDEIPN